MKAMVLEDKDKSLFRKIFHVMTDVSVDKAIFIIFLVMTNTHLVTGNINGSLAFFPSAVGSGEWWRLVTHPFVHITWYHLLLDGVAFFLLYGELNTQRVSKKIFYVVICGTCSLITVLLTEPAIYSIGLCGLSGIAHGLMAISSLEMMREKESFKTGSILLSIVVVKSMYEALAGDVLFSFMHFGLCGSPIAVSHAGGVLGGLVAYYISRKSLFKD